MVTVIKSGGISSFVILLYDNSLKGEIVINKTCQYCGFLPFDACFKRFTRGLGTYANAFSHTLTHSWPYLIGFVEGLFLP